jgi:GTPase SAR1 family protein
MGAVLNLCTGSAQQIIIPNTKLVIENDMIYNYNKDLNGVKIESNTNKDIVEEKKNKKKSSGGTSIIEQICDQETYNVVSSSKGVSILTTKIKKEKSSPKKIHKKEDKISTKEKESKKDEGNDETNSKKKKKKKSKSKSYEQKIGLEENNASVKKSNNVEVEEDFGNMDISDTILSEIVMNEKLKTISKEKKKKIKGRNYINIVILGHNETGKSSFCIRYVENKYEGYYIPSIGVENYTKFMAYNDRSYKLNFSVIGGGTKILQQKNLLEAADFFLLIYDITNIRSFNLINIYLKVIKKYLVLFDKGGKSPNFCLAGNKSDLEGERKIGLDFINKCVDKNGIKHFDISTKTANNMNNLIFYFVNIFDKISSSDK